MKAIREVGFQPITIIIETEEEAFRLWHLLNTNESNLDSYALSHNISSLDLATDEMWRIFNKVYCPEKER